MKVRTVRSLRTASKQGVESHIKYRSVKNKQWDEYLQNRNREKLLYRELFMQHQKWTYLLSGIVYKKKSFDFRVLFTLKIEIFLNEMAKMNSEGNFENFKISIRNHHLSDRETIFWSVDPGVHLLCP